ncbi:MAG: helix-hairpin-helix domain-containing protein [Bacteroidota bacterium]
MRKNPTNIILFCLIAFASLSHAQKDSSFVDSPLYDIDPVTREYIENIVEDSDAEFDFVDIFDRLETFRRKPLNLNKATEEDLAGIGLLTSFQAIALVRYRAIAGDLISIYELQAVPGFDLGTINRIIPYVRINEGQQGFQVSPLKMLYQGENELFFRWSRVLEEAIGFSPPFDSTDTRYLGDPNKYYVRFRHNYENRLSWGFTLEKDPGEEFFSGSNKQGFDFYSFHLAYKNISPLVKSIVLGDFDVNFGQGLVMSSGFSNGKSSYVTSIKRSQTALRPYRSVNEAVFLRGGGFTLGLSDNFELTGFASYRARDANVTQIDTLENLSEVSAFSSLQESGLHRTPAEIEDENAINQFTTGGGIKWQSGQQTIGVNAVYNSFDASFNRTIQPYNQFFFNSGKLFNLSTEYGFLVRNLNFFGETAWSDNGGFATTNGLLIGVDRKVDIALLYRYFGKDFQALYGNPFAETSSGNNEAGLYVGVEVNPNYNWQISGYFDAWQHPWLRFRTDGIASGYEYLVQVRYRIKRRMEVYLRFRDEYKPINAPDNDTPVDFLTTVRKTNIRLNVNNKVSRALELRNRLELVFYDDQESPVSRGFMLYQDVIYKPIGIPFSFTGRFAIFNTDDYDSRVYAYENDLLYSFSIPPYAYKGLRYYLNLRYKGIRNTTLEFRISQSYVRDRTSFGSFLSIIPGLTRTEVKAQLKYKF